MSFTPNFLFTQHCVYYLWLAPLSPYVVPTSIPHYQPELWEELTLVTASLSLAFSLVNKLDMSITMTSPFYLLIISQSLMSSPYLGNHHLVHFCSLDPFQSILHIATTQTFLNANQVISLHLRTSSLFTLRWSNFSITFKGPSWSGPCTLHLLPVLLCDSGNTELVYVLRMCPVLCCLCLCISLSLCLNTPVLLLLASCCFSFIRLSRDMSSPMSSSSNSPACLVPADLFPWHLVLLRLDTLFWKCQAKYSV